YTEPMITKTTKVYNFTTNTFSQHTITTTPVTFGYKTDTQEKMISDLPKDTVLAAIRDARARISCGRY
ncbi:hypothetical protein KC721_01580, partial [Candidatus Woesebacteria bacterium]|nr:hypothetical protein [Candidatus Woesebacteria bacterium]